MEFVKINKTQARKLHSEGRRIFCLPNKVNPHSMWMSPAEISVDRDFDKFCNEYQYYNCGTTELGKSIAFYKEDCRFEPRQRTAVDGKVWWVVYDKFSQQYSTLTYFGKYRTKQECQNAIILNKEVK